MDPYPHNINNNGNHHHHHQNHHHPQPDSSSNVAEATTIIQSREGAVTTTFSRGDKRSLRYWVLLIISYTSLVVGSISSSLLSRYYFIHGGSSRWVSTWVQSAGFPLLLIPIYCPHFIHFFFKSSSSLSLSSSSTPPPRPFSQLTPRLFLISIGIGFMLGFNNFLFSWGVSYLPVSTASLLLSSQLAFNLILSVIIVKQKITFTNFNCVILLTLSSILLALTASHDRPKGVSQSHYFLGFFSILGAGLLFALYLPLVDMAYRKVHCFEMVIEMQVVMEVAATVLATIGMVADGGFREMKREGSVYDLGKTGYWLTVGFSLLCWQMCFVGTAGLVFLTTSLNGGICMTALLPMNVFGGVLAYGDSFGGAKGISTVLCVWGFCSYLYGEYVNLKRQKEDDLRDEKNRDEKEMMNRETMMNKKNQAEPPDDDQLEMVALNSRSDLV